MNKLLLLSIICLSIASCSKKSSPDPTKPATTSDITGKWTAVADTLYRYKNNIVWETDVFTGEVDQDVNYEFKADGTNILTSQSDHSVVEVDTYKINKNVITFYHPAQTRDGLQYDAYSQDATIKKHTPKSLVIAYDDTTNPNRDYEIVYLIK